MITIDAHQHFWNYHPENHAWINGEMAVIRRDFLPAELGPLLQENGVSGCIAVQAEQTEGETEFLLELSQKHAFIKAVVGWVDLRAPNISDKLTHFKAFDALRGFRHVLQGEDPAFMLQPDFLRGVAALKAHGFTYDILIFPHQLQAALQLVRQNPGQAFVIDHLAKPYIKSGLISDWRKDLQAIAAAPNVHCKISGMVTEANWQTWNPGTLQPYLDAVVEAFGVDRLMFGSDWPVCLVASSYAQWLATLRQYFEPFSQSEQAAIFGGNAERFYGLKAADGE